MDFLILGPLEARLDGRELPLGGAKQRALLALLLLQRNEVVSTDRLIDGLWGEEPPATALKVVHTYVSRLRRLLGSERLLTRPPGYLLQLDPDELDLDRFDRLADEARRASAAGDPAAASAALHRGLAMWRGPPLADLAFEPFAQAAALRLEEQRLAAVEDRVEADLALGRAPELVGELSPLVGEHPYRERMRAHLMLALYRSGRQTEALDAYRAARRALVDELGIEPSPGLADLERAILRHDPALAVSAATTPTPPARAPIARHAAIATTAGRRQAGPHTAAIVGRRPILTRIDEGLDASASSGAVLRIVGDAGLGKTRLVQEAAERARGRGRLVLEGRATPTDAASALGVFRDLVRADRRARPDADPPGDPLAASFPSWLLPELGAPPGESELDRGVLFEAASRHFRALARRTGLVMVLEDLHLADPASHALVHYVARTSADEPLFLLLTYRPHETPGDSSLSQLVHELVRDRLGDEVVLQPLDESAVGELVASLAGCSPDAEALATIAAMSDGNPFAVEEIVRAALEEGYLDPSSGRLRTGGRLELPQTVQEMLVASIRRLSAGDRELLCWASVAGESFDVRLLIAVSGGSEDEVLAGLDRLCAAGLVVDEGGSGRRQRLAFRQAETRDAAAGELPAPERQRRHARLLEAAEALYAGAPDTPVEELASHALAAGDRERAFHYSVQAARRCLELGGYGQARDHFARARDLWERPDGLEARAQLLLAYGRLLVRVTHDPEAVTILDQARDAFEALGYGPGATAARAAAAEARYNLGEAARALADARALASEVGPEGAPEARLLAVLTLARLLSLRGEVVEASDVASEGLALVSSAPSRPQTIARARLLNVLGGATWLQGDPAAGATAMLESARLADEVGDQVGVVRAYTNLAVSATWYGCEPIEAAVGWADAGLAIASAHGLLPAEGWLAAVRAAACLEAGVDQEVAPLLERAERALTGAGPVPHVSLALQVSRAERHLSDGALDEAAAGFAAALQQADDLGHPGSSWLVRDGLARARLAAGDAAGAGAALAPAMAALRAQPALLRSFQWLATSAVEVAAALGDDEVADVTGWLEREAPGANARYAAALASAGTAAPARAGEIEGAARAMEEAGRRWRAAWIRFTGAKALARDGGGDPAAELATAALSSFRALGRDGWCRAAEEVLRGLGRPVPMPGTGAGATA